MKKNFKGLLAIWMAAAMMLAMMLPAAAATKEYQVYTGTTALKEGTWDSDTNPSGEEMKNQVDTYTKSITDISELEEDGYTLTGFNIWHDTNHSGYLTYTLKLVTSNAEPSLEKVHTECSVILEPIYTANPPTSRGGACLLFWYMHDVDFVIDEETIETVTVRYGERIAAPEAVAPEGYEFTGWYTDADCTEAFDLETKFRTDVIREVETLYAGYAPIEAEEIEDAE